MGKNKKRRTNAQSSATAENLIEKQNDSPVEGSMINVSQATDRTDMYDHNNDIQAYSI